MKNLWISTCSKRNYSNIWKESISSKTKTKLKNSLKNIFKCYKLIIVFTSKTRLNNKFHFKDRIPKHLASDIIYQIQCGICNESCYGECETLECQRWLTYCYITTYQKKVKPKSSSVANHLLFCNHSASMTILVFLTRENKKFLVFTRTTKGCNER